MRRLNKLVALGTMITLFAAPGMAFSNNQMTDTNSKAVDAYTTSEPMEEPMQQRELTNRDLEAVNYAKTVLKSYFDYETDGKDLIIDVYYSSDYNDEQYPKDDSFRDNISVSFMPKDDNYMDGAYMTYYEDDKDIMSASTSNINYEANRKFSKEKGHEIAKKFLADKAKVDLSMFVYKNFPEPEYGEGYATGDYYYQRMENGIEFDADFASATVDLSSGKVVSFYKNFTKNITFPSEKPNLTASEALDIVKDKFVSSLGYITSPTDTNKAIPVYLIDTSSGESVDAHTKKIYTYGAEDYRIEKIDKTSEEVQALIKDIKPIDMSANNKGQAVLIANNLIKEIYGVELTPMQQDYDDDPNNVYILYQDKKAMLEYYVSMSISGNKNLVISKSPMYVEGMENNYYDTSQKSAISYKQAYDIAIKALARIAPEELKTVDFKQINYVFKADENNQIEYYFNFPRKVDGILFQEDYLDVRVNSVTKSVESMSIFWDNNKTFDSIEGIIKPEVAKGKFLSDKTMQLKYTMDYYETQKSGKSIIKLLYIMIPKDDQYKGNYIDAKTGAFIEYPAAYYGYN